MATSWKPLSELELSYAEFTTLPPSTSPSYTVDTDDQYLPVLQTDAPAYAYVDPSGTFIVEDVLVWSQATVTTSGLVVSEIVGIVVEHTAGPFIETTDDDGLIRMAVWTATDSLSIISTSTVYSTLGWSTLGTTSESSATSSLAPTANGTTATSSSAHENTHKQNLLGVMIAVPNAAVQLLLVGILAFMSMRRKRRAQDAEYAASASNDSAPPVVTERKAEVPSSPASSTAPPLYEAYAKINKDNAPLPQIVEANNESTPRQTATHELFDEESLGMRPTHLSTESSARPNFDQKQHLQPQYTPYHPPASPAAFDVVRDETIRKASREHAPRPSMEVSPVSPEGQRGADYFRMLNDGGIRL